MIGNIGIISGAIILAVANGLKGLERVWATLKITLLYHHARENNPESLGSNPEESRNKVEGFLQKTIWMVMFHFMNLFVCVFYIWFIFKGNGFGSWKAPILIFGLISLFGCLGVVWDLGTNLYRSVTVHFKLVGLGMKNKTEGPSITKTIFIVFLGITQYLLTGVVAGYLLWMIK